MRKLYFLLIIMVLLLLPGCKKTEEASEKNVMTEDDTQNIEVQTTDLDTTETDSSGRIEQSGVNKDKKTDDKNEYYRLDSPVFLEQTKLKLCPLANEYITMSYKDFSKKYSTEELWKSGVFNGLLFTKQTKGTIIEDISIGDSIHKIKQRFGNPQFGTKDTYNPDANDYNRFLLFGYKTKNYYFAFQLNAETEKVESVCIKKRYELPDNQKDMLQILVGCSGWFSDSSELDKQKEYFNEDTIEYTQFRRGTMSMISKYGFICTSGEFSFDTYLIYADFEGDVPKLPMFKDEYTNSSVDPVEVSDMDYPELQINNVYTYLAEQENNIENNIGVLSSNEDILAYAEDGNVLDLTKSSGLYETANVVIHWMNGEKPDRQIYFGHYSTIVGIINDRYLVESNMLGLNVYDIEKDEIVYSEEDVVTGRDDFSIDTDNQYILDSDNKTWYKYTFDHNGNLKIDRLLEY